MYPGTRGALVVVLVGLAWIAAGLWGTHDQARNQTAAIELQKRRVYVPRPSIAHMGEGVTLYALGAHVD